MGIGAGQLETVLVAAGVALIVLLVFRGVVNWINRIREARTYKIVIGTGNIDVLENLKQVFRDCHLVVAEDHMQISEGSMTSSWHTVGRPENHDQLVRMLLQNKDVLQLEY